MDSLKVFVSSTFVDLQAERAAVDSALRHLRDTRFVGMEHFGARSEGAAEISLDELERCDIYVGVIGLRRGSGITEIEYRRALQRGMPCLVYQRRGPAPADLAAALDPQQEALRNEMRGRHVVVDFDSPHELALRVVADLHRLIIERLVTRSASGLAHQVDGAIRNFVFEYSGSAHEPVIFGGRTQELDFLDGWLDDDQAPPCVVVVAPAGRGKSALLVHWVQRQAARKDATPIFFPISIRFGTNLAAQAYASIATRLAALHGEPVGDADESATEVWRGLLISYLMRPLPEGRRAVIVLDGADECGDWQLGPDLLPANPPAGLKFLVSARYLTGDADATAWLHRLGWSRPRQALALDLHPLTPSGLVSLLRGMSVPLETLSERHDVVAELFRLSEGDPLLVKLYVADLWALGDDAARLQPADLLRIEPGLEGYFRRWWDDQRALWGTQSPLREPGVNDLLNTLACALGPLSTGELMDLLPPEGSLDLWALEETMQVLRRFVVGDGQSQGYVFGHPRLGEYFFNRLRVAGRALRHEQRFVDWGLRCLQELESGRRSPAELPIYIPQFLRRHMERVASPAATVCALISPTWMKAWEPLDRGSCDGFLTDMTRAQAIVSSAAALQAAAGHASALPVAELRSTLYASSISTLAADTSVQLLSMLVQRGIWSPAQAIAHASRIPLLAQRCATLAWLGTALDPAFRPLALAATLLELRRLTDGVHPSPEWDDLAGRLKPETGSPEPTEAFAARLAFVAQAARQLEAAPRYRVGQTLVDLVRDWRDAGLAAAVLMRLQPWLDEPAYGRRVGELEVLSCGVASEAMSLDDPEASERLAALQAVLALPLSAPQRVEAVETALKCALAIALRVAIDGPPGSACTAAAIEQVLALAPWLPDDAPALTRRIGRRLDAGQLDALQRVTLGAPVGLRLRHLLALLEVASAVIRHSHVEAFIETLGDPALAADDALAALVEAAPGLDAGATGRALDALEVRVAPEALIVAHDDITRSVEPARRGEHAARVLCLLARLPADRQAVALSTLDAPGQRDSFAGPRGHAGEDPAAASDLGVALRRLAALPGLEALARPAPPHAWDIGEAPAADLESVLRGLEPALADEVLAGRLMLCAEPELLFGALAQPGLNTDDQLSLLQRLVRFTDPQAVREAVALVLDDRDRPPNQGVDELVALVVAACAEPLRPPTDETLGLLKASARVVWSRDSINGPRLCELARDSPLPDSLRDAWITVALQEIAALDGGSIDMLGKPSARRVGAEHVLAVLGDALRLCEPSTELLQAALSLRLPEGHEALVEQRIQRLLERADTSPLPTLLGALLLAPSGAKAQRLDAVRRGWSSRGDGFWSAVIDAAGMLPSASLRADTVVLLAGQAPPEWRVRAAALVSDIRDGAARLTAITALLAKLPADERHRLLPDAMALLQSTAAGPWAIGAVVSVAIQDPSLPDESRRDLLALAQAQPEASDRRRLVARLASVLDDETLRAATVELQRLDDVLARIGALAGLARCESGGPQAAAAERLGRAIDEIEPAVQRDTALLSCSSLLPPRARWPRLLACFVAARPLPAGFDAQALARDLCKAVQDAPAAVCEGALDWVARARLRDPAAVATALAPTLPLPLLWAAAARFGGTAEAWDPCLTPAAMAYARQRRDGLPRAARQLIEAVQSHRGARWPVLAWERSLAVDLPHALRRCKTSLQRATAVRDWALHPGATAEALPAALDALDRIGDPELHRDTLAHLAVLADDESGEAAQRWVLSLRSPVRRAWALMRLEEAAPPSQRPGLTLQALQALLDEPELEARVWTAVRWATRHPEDIEAVLPMLVSARPEPAVADALCQLLRQLPDAAAAATVHRLRSVADPLLRERILCAPDPLPGPAAAAAALAAIAELPTGAARSRVLAVLAPSLPDAVQAAAVEELARLAPDFAWLQAVQALATRWPELWTEDRLRQALPLLDAIVDDEDRGRWLHAALACWPAGLGPAFVEAARGVRAEGLRAELLACAATLRADLDAEGVLGALRAIGDPFQRAVALGQLASLRDDAALWPEVLADAARAAGRQVEVEALACIAVAAGRLASPVLAALLRLHAHRPAQVGTVLTNLAPLVQPAQVEAILAVLPPEYSRPWAERMSPRLAAEASTSDPTPDAAPQSLPPDVEALAVQAQAAADVAIARQRLASLLAAGPPPTAPAPREAAAALHRARDPGALVRRLQTLESGADRRALLRQVLADDPGLRVDALLEALRHGLDPVAWSAVADELWVPWLHQAPVAAVGHMADSHPPGQALTSLVDASHGQLVSARPVLYPCWRNWLAAARTRDRATVLAELAQMAPVLAALGDEAALQQAMDDVIATARVWP